ncbi:formyl peptide receptor 2-like [Xenopus laevis]|uniref:Formyl peptide receptor 2-like n=1 Tax=Xenopus laevis TaxID=8355 RepID=A0A8J1LAW2_XENLA|nr:formyl peptide receptor 2-like [Xenopus laevis]
MFCLREKQSGIFSKHMNNRIMDNVSISLNTTMNSTSEIHELDPQIKRIGHILYVASMVLYLVAFLLGTTGNGLVIWIAGFRMKKTINSVWFLNLAIADFLFTFFLPIIFVYFVLYFHWPFGNFMCKLYSTLTFINMFASVFLLTAISIDRCVSVVYPVWSQNHRTPRLASLVTLIIWLLALCASVPYFVFRDTYVEHHGSITCYIDYGSTDDGVLTDSGKLNIKATVTTRFILGFFIPFAIIVFCYTVIAFKLKMNHTFTSTKPFKIIVAVLISFFVCWFPFHVFSFLEMSRHTNEDIPQSILDIGIPITTSLAFLNSCVNPFLYVFMGREVKSIFRNSIQVALENAFSEDLPKSYVKSKSKTIESNLV